VTVNAPPRPSKSSVHAHGEEFEALVEALIEEARRRARKRRRRYAGVAALALLMGFLLFGGVRGAGNDSTANVASAAPATPATLDATTTSISFRLLSIETSIRFVDRPPKGTPNKGDTVYVKDELRNGSAGQFGRPRNALVGRDSMVRTFLAKPGWELDTLNVTLPGGTLRLRARGPMQNQAMLFHVVGGTGRYANAHGTMAWQMRGTANLNDYQLEVGKRP
jgi:hypothetical protein